MFRHYVLHHYYEEHHEVLGGGFFVLFIMIIDLLERQQQFDHLKRQTVLSLVLSFLVCSLSIIFVRFLFSKRVLFLIFIPKFDACISLYILVFRVERFFSCL